VYEQFFGLDERPFSAVPHAGSFVPVPPLQDGLDALVHCLSHARGIAVITGSAGMGKTQLCKTLASLLHQEFKTIFMNAASLQSRRSLLQAALFELQVDYVGLSEHEARLQLLDAARRAQSNRQRLILVIDDAQLLHLRLYEELRGLADYAPDGEPLIHVVLAGQFELEETLADPTLAQFAQRIGVQICLEPLGLTESGQFICERLRQCGAADPSLILTPHALELICLASDGNPRCLAQLTDMTLLLAFADDQRPANDRIVRAALKDLRELPLHWAPIPDEPAESSDPSAAQKEIPIDLPDDFSGVRSSSDPAQQETDEFPIPDFLRNSPIDEEAPVGEAEEEISSKPWESIDSTGETQEEFAVYEVGAGLSEVELAAPHVQLQPASVVDSEPAAPLNSGTIDMESQMSVSTIPRDPMMTEFQVIDRYTLLDRLLELPEERRGSVNLALLDEDRVEEKEVAAPVVRSGCSASEEAELLETVQQIRDEISIRFPYLSEIDAHASGESVRSVSARPAPAVVEAVPYSSAQTTQQISGEEQRPADQERRFGLLFTRLRTRRQQAQASRHES
jgi:type II secretory pathway predicted ATPase ExeA